jgi:hypothetical protein
MAGLPDRAPERAGGTAPLAIELSAAIVAVTSATPQILVTQNPSEAGKGAAPHLPAGPFDPARHRTFEMGLRAWVSEQTGMELGYVEQLYTFGDRGRTDAAAPSPGPDHGAPRPAHVVSVGYLALTRGRRQAGEAGAAPPPRLMPWYRLFPWEDWRQGRPAMLDRSLLPLLVNWAADAAGEAAEQDRRALTRRQRLALTFGLDGAPWDEERTLERYELLYDAGLVAEARRDGRPAALAQPSLPAFGEAMAFDHRRILATAIGRLRAKLKYRPVIFELMPPEFTLSALQATAEAISGRPLHKQNFRRLVEGGGLVEPTGQMSRTGGRPAALFRFRREVEAERPAPGLRLRGRG